MVISLKPYNSITDILSFILIPPYRPLSSTSNFNSYIKEPFNDEEQIRLKEFVVDLSTRE